jgi:DNA-directed RNA polymerase specialized sigma24 family protein
MVDPVQSNQARKFFESEISRLLNPKNEEEKAASNAFFAYIKRLIYQFNLYTAEPYEITSEAYIRAINFIKTREEEIKSPVAFMKGISVNVIREMSRKQIHSSPVEPKELESKVKLDDFNTNLVYEDFYNSSSNSLKAAIQTLNSKDRKIIFLWKVEELPWKEVVKKLSSSGETLNIASARKRGQRALERLRKELN